MSNNQTPNIGQLLQEAFDRRANANNIPLDDERRVIIYKLPVEDDATESGANTSNS